MPRGAPAPACIPAAPMSSSPWSFQPPLLPSLLPSFVARTALLLLAACASGETATEAAPPPVARLVLRAAVDTIYLGDVHTLVAQPDDASGSPLGGRPITWTSQAPALASVSGDGAVTGML